MIKYLGLPINASQDGGGIDNLILYVHLLMAVLFAGWLAYFLYTVWRFRASRNKRADYIGVKNHASSYLEGVVALVEAILLIGFAIPLWGKAVDQFPGPDKNPTEIKIVGQQFAWNARYPGADKVFGSNDVRFVSATNTFGLDKTDSHAKDDYTVLNELEVPVNKPVIVHISSMDVIHCFAIKPMRVTQDAIPGMNIPAWFTPVQEGQYLINCAQLCGNGHSKMHGYLKVVSQAEYDKWVASRSAAGSQPASFE
jgi:cytochrome c oxidase subunit 2